MTTEEEWLQGNAAVRLMNDRAPSTSLGVRRLEWLKGVLVDLVATGTVVAGEPFKALDRVEDVADAQTFGDAVNVGQRSLERETGSIERLFMHKVLA